MQNCARPWSTRRQRPRCSASSAARRRMCSRCLMLSSRARRRFVGSMTWYCGSAKGPALSRGRILVPYPCPRTASRSILMSHSIAGCVSMERFTFRMSASGTTFQFVSMPPGVRGYRSRLTAPLRQQGEIVGVLNARRTEVRPFTPTQIKLLETFADQAVIALENVRLFNELKESLEQQTATSEILGVIASSPTDIQPVLDVIAANAARLCGSDDAQIYRVETDIMRKVASYGVIPTARIVGETRPIGRGTVSGRAIVDRQTVHIPDVLAEAERFPDNSQIRDPRGIRTYLATPLLREGTPIGVIVIRRTEVKPFTDKQVALLETFAVAGGDCYRERPLVQRDPRAQRRIARGAGASDGNGRGARHHQPLAHGRAAGP